MPAIVTARPAGSRSWSGCDGVDYFEAWVTVRIAPVVVEASESRKRDGVEFAEFSP